MMERMITFQKQQQRMLASQQLGTMGMMMRETVIPVFRDGAEIALIVRRRDGREYGVRGPDGGLLDGVPHRFHTLRAAKRYFRRDA